MSNTTALQSMLIYLIDKNVIGRPSSLLTIVFKLIDFSINFSPIFGYTELSRPLGM